MCVIVPFAVLYLQYICVSLISLHHTHFYNNAPTQAEDAINREAAADPASSASTRQRDWRGSGSLQLQR